MIKALRPNTPSENSALREGDMLVEICGQSIRGWHVDTIVSLLQRAGRVVTLAVLRERPISPQVEACDQAPEVINVAPAASSLGQSGDDFGPANTAISRVQSAEAAAASPAKLRWGKVQGAIAGVSKMAKQAGVQLSWFERVELEVASEAAERGCETAQAADPIVAIGRHAHLVSSAATPAAASEAFCNLVKENCGADASSSDDDGHPAQAPRRARRRSSAGQHVLMRAAQQSEQLAADTVPVVALAAVPLRTRRPSWIQRSKDLEHDAQLCAKESTARAPPIVPARTFRRKPGQQRLPHQQPKSPKNSLDVMRKPFSPQSSPDLISSLSPEASSPGENSPSRREATVEPVPTPTLTFSSLPHESALEQDQTAGSARKKSAALVADALALAARFEAAERRATARFDAAERCTAASTPAARSPVAAAGLHAAEASQQQASRCLVPPPAEHMKGALDMNSRTPRASESESFVVDETQSRSESVTVTDFGLEDDGTGAQASNAKDHDDAGELAAAKTALANVEAQLSQAEAQLTALPVLQAQLKQACSVPGRGRAEGSGADPVALALPVLLAQVSEEEARVRSFEVELLSAKEAWALAQEELGSEIAQRQAVQANVGAITADAEKAWGRVAVLLADEQRHSERALHLQARVDALARKEKLAQSMAIDLQQQMNRSAELLCSAEKRATELEAHAEREQELRRAAENKLQLSETRNRALEADHLLSGERQWAALQKSQATEKTAKQINIELQQQVRQEQSLRRRAEEHAAAMEHQLREFGAAATTERERVHAQEQQRQHAQQSAPRIRQQAALDAVRPSPQVTSRLCAGAAPVPVSQRLETAYQRAKRREGSSSGDGACMGTVSDPRTQLLSSCCSRQLEIIAELAAQIGSSSVSPAIWESMKQTVDLLEAYRDDRRSQ